MPLTPPPTAKLEHLARTLTSATDGDLKDLAATRRGLLLAPLLAALPAALLTDPAHAIDPAQTQVTLPDQYQWKPALPGAPAQSVETVRGIRRDRQARAVRGADQVASGLHERAAHLRHRPAVLCHLRHLVGEFRRDFRAGGDRAGARRRLRPPRRAHPAL